MNVKNLTADQHGSITIEFVAISLMMILFINTLIGLAQYQAMSGKLDRVVYSITGVLRERTQFYNANYSLRQDQVGQLLKLAQKIMTDTNPNFDKSKLSLTVEVLTFNDISTSWNKVRTFTAGSAKCTPYQPLEKMTKLAPKKQNGSQIPIYQVTLCMPLPFLSKYINMLPPVKSYSVMFAR